MLFASTAREGPALIDENISLVFLHITLPDASGIEALKRIKQERPSISRSNMAVANIRSLKTSYQSAKLLLDVTTILTFLYRV